MMRIYHFVKRTWSMHRLGINTGARIYWENGIMQNGIMVSHPFNGKME